MSKAGWTLVIVTAAVGTGLYMSRKPWNEYQRQRQITKQAEADMRKAEQDRAEYVRQTALAQNPSGREAIARERGFRKPNEIAVEELK